MKYAFFIGCKIPYFLEHYGASTRAVLEKLGVGLVDVEFNCCGYPIRNLHFDSYILSGARNLALAQARGLDILTPCKCCFGNLIHADNLLRSDPGLLVEVNTVLRDEGLEYHGGTEVKHLLTVLDRDVGAEAIAEKVVRPLEGLRVAAHYGCHALRPSKETHFDDPFSPTIFERLVDAIGAQSVMWSKRLDCCGNPVWGKNNDLANKLMQSKIDSAIQAEADCLTTACTYCQAQFDAVQKARLNGNALTSGLPSFLYTQLLGMSLGLGERHLGFRLNKMHPGAMERYINAG